MALAGTRVLLVDADLHHPSLAQVFAAGDRPGLTELLAGRAELGDERVPADLPGLQLVTSGEEDHPAELFDTTRLAPILQGLRAAADVVIVDTGPVLSVSDPIPLALRSDLVLMVANVRRSRRASIRVAAQELRTAGPVTVAGVLAGLPRSLVKPAARPAQASRPEAPPKATLPPDLRAEARCGGSPDRHPARRLGRQRPAPRLGSPRWRHGSEGPPRPARTICGRQPPLAARTRGRGGPGQVTVPASAVSRMARRIPGAGVVGAGPRRAGYAHMPRVS